MRSWHVSGPAAAYVCVHMGSLLAQLVLEECATCFASTLDFGCWQSQLSPYCAGSLLPVVQAGMTCLLLQHNYNVGLHHGM